LKGLIVVMYMLEAIDVHFKYSDGFQALRGVGFKIKKGEIVGLLGANGCGKTTLFMLFNGLLKPSAGNVIIKGMNIQKWNENELYKTVGLVFQNPDDQLFAPTVFEDVSYGLINMGLGNSEINERVEKSLMLLKMWEYKNKLIHTLSYGQKRRAAIAGILAMEPEILILDEPTAGLDPMGVSELMNLLGDIQRKLSISVILSTHDIDLVPLYCNRVYVMNKGEIVLKGSPKQIFSEASIIRGVNLRLPRIGHLMEILRDKDEFDFKETAVTISQARKLLVDWKKSL